MARTPKGPILKYNESLSPDQHDAKKVAKNSTISCFLGYAGTGKTRIATTYALEQYALGRKNGGIDKIIITRPTAFKKEHNVGFLPGDIAEKYDPWVRPISEIIIDIEGAENYEKLIKERDLEIVPLMFVQGRTFSNSIVIIDEAQNLTRDDTKALFTRLGRNSQMIFCGDTNQCIIDRRDSGFERLCEMSKLINDINIYELITNWRHPIIEELLNEY
jgi:phosphate starvation-inducible PhoH-like protein